MMCEQTGVPPARRKDWSMLKFVRVCYYIMGTIVIIAGLIVLCVSLFAGATIKPPSP
jgi:uncharacterized membrane protein HdeD (DUF308 family)